MNGIVGAGQIVSRTLRGESLFTCYSKQRSEIRYQIITNIKTQASQIEQFFALSKNEKAPVVKVITQPEHEAGIKDIINRAGVTPEKIIPAPWSNFEVILYGSEGRVRVGPITKSEPAPKTSTEVAPSPLLKKVRVLIVDDSSTMRHLLQKIFASDPAIEVVGAAGHPSEVEGMIKALKPDLLTLDIHMPDMDGVTLLSKLFPIYKVPAVMVTSVSMEESDLVFRALEIGAVDYIQKPSLEQLDEVIPVILEKVKSAARAKAQVKSVGAAPKAIGPQEFQEFDKVIAIGSSTGGTEALKVLLTGLPKKIPPIVIVQHIPPVFSLAFANRLASICPFQVKEAANGDEVLPNRVLIAPGGFQMSLRQGGGKLTVKVEDAPPVNRHKPAVDVLFDSAALLLKDRALGVILTGMGADGAKGLLKMRQAGARTIAQDEQTCVVYGMPREAVQIGGAEFVCPLPEIAGKLVNLIARKAA